LYLLDAAAVNKLQRNKKRYAVQAAYFTQVPTSFKRCSSSRPLRGKLLAGGEDDNDFIQNTNTVSKTESKNINHPCKKVG
jgi:hypothetical protein